MVPISLTGKKVINITSKWSNKEEEATSMSTFATSSQSLQGTRDENQDAELVYDNYSGHNRDCAPVALFGIFDGHGKDGKKIAEYTCELHKYYYSDPNLSYPVDTRKIREISDKIQLRLIRKYPAPPGSERGAEGSGSCALLVALYRDENGFCKMQILNVGDSRAMLSRKLTGLQLTHDQTPNSFIERQRIDALIAQCKDEDPKNISLKNAEVRQDNEGTWRTCDLSVARAYGDNYAKPFVTHYPENWHNFTIINNDAFIVLACDGVWDVFSTTELHDFIVERMVPDHYGKPVLKRGCDIASEICDEALKKGSSDNVSCIVVFL